MTCFFCWYSRTYIMGYFLDLPKYFLQSGEGDIQDRKVVKKMREPAKQEIIDKLELVLQNKLTKEEVADWASKYVVTDDYPVTDLTVFRFLKTVSGLDTLLAPGEYMYDDGDIKNWMNKYSNK